MVFYTLININTTETILMSSRLKAPNTLFSVFIFSTLLLQGCASSYSIKSSGFEFNRAVSLTNVESKSFYIEIEDIINPLGACQGVGASCGKGLISENEKYNLIHSFIDGLKRGGMNVANDYNDADYLMRISFQSKTLKSIESMPLLLFNITPIGWFPGLFVPGWPIPISIENINMAASINVYSKSIPENLIFSTSTTFEGSVTKSGYLSSARYLYDDFSNDKDYMEGYGKLMSEQLKGDINYFLKN